MMKKLIITLGLAAVVLTIVWLVTTREPTAPEGSFSQSSAPESELEESLKNANPTEEQMLREIELLREQALQEGGLPEAEEAPPSSRDAAAVLASTALMERPYDLAALEEDLIAALQNPEMTERRSSLERIAIFLAEQRDPEMAARFMQAVSSTRDRFTDSDAYTFATLFVDHLSRTDPETAAEWTESLPERLRYPTQQRVAANWTPQSPAAVEAWANSIGDEGLRASVIRMMSQSLSASDPEGYALDWAKRLAQNGADGPRLSEIVVEHWGPAEFEAALQWTVNLPNEDDRKDGVLALVKATTRQDAAGTAKWVETSLDGAVRREAIQLTVSSWLSQDPASAAGWVDQLDDPEAFNNAFDMIAIAWMRSDPAAAEPWVESAPVSQERKDYVHAVSQD